MKPKVTEQMAKKIYSVLPQTKVGDAFTYMTDKRVRHLLVVDEAQLVVGIISDRDLNRAMKTQIDDSMGVKIMTERFNSNELVQDYMSWCIECADENTEIKDIANKMLSKKISSMVIINEEQEVKGIITTDDLLLILIQLLDDKEGGFLEDLRLKLMNSTLGPISDSLSRSGV